MDADEVGWLRTEDGRAATAQASALLSAGSELTALRTLGRHYEAPQARAAVALAHGRTVAAKKFEDAERLWCDREAAEQASHRFVSEHLAARFTDSRYVADLGCGMGADALAMARYARVLGVDREEGRLAMLIANAEARGLSGRIEAHAADLDTWDVPESVDAVWCDPARREADGRRLRPETWSPSLSRAIELGRQAAGAGIKLAPGIDLDALPKECEVEFVSMDRGLRAAVLWLGRLARSPRTATVLPTDGAPAVSLTGEADRGETPLGEPGAYLYDPDPSVGRAGLVEMLAVEIGAWKLTEGIAYLSADTASETLFARRYRVLSWVPFAERRIAEALASLGIARVEVTRRGSPVDTNALERRLNRGLRGDRAAAPAVVVLTRVQEMHVAIVCARE